MPIGAHTRLVAAVCGRYSCRDIYDNIKTAVDKVQKGMQLLTETRIFHWDFHWEKMSSNIPYTS